MVVYYINRVSENLAEHHYPIKEGDICMLYDGEVVKSIYIDSEIDEDSIWRDFKFIDTKSLKSYQFPKSDSILCAPTGDRHAIGNTGLLTQLIKECKGEWLLDFLNETSAVLSGFVDYWDLGILRRFIDDDDVEVAYENEEALTEFLVKPEKNEDIDEYDEEEYIDDTDFLPKSYDIKLLCLSALACIEGQIDKRSYQILYDTLNGVSRNEIASRFNLTKERIRQIVVKTTKQVKELLIEQRKSIEETKAENVQLNAQLKLLKEDIVGLKALLPKETITQLGNENEGLSAELASLLETPITDIDLPVRAANILIHMGIKKFADIPQIDSHTRVLKEKNSGKKTVHDISRMLEDFYLTFGMSYTEIVNVLNVKDWHIAKKKWIKECEHKESTKKLDDNDNKTIGEIKDKTIIVPKDAQINSYDQSYSVSKPSSWKSDRAKYSEDNEWLNKRRFVLETVRAYVRLHPHISYDSLIRVFPASLNYNKANGVILRYDDVTKKLTFNPRTQNYFFLKDDEIVELSDGTKVVVHSQWGTDFDNFLKVAVKLFHVKTKGDRYK